jgi:hypothetical protein
LNPDLFLDRVSCLKSLQIDILNKPEYGCYSTQLYRNFKGTSSKDIARIISQNPRLKHLHIRLVGWEPNDSGHDLGVVEKEHALENIGEHVHKLESLALEGELHFTHSA